MLQTPSSLLHGRMTKEPRSEVPRPAREQVSGIRSGTPSLDPERMDLIRGQGIRLRARVTARCTDLGRLALVRAARKSSILLHGPSLGDGPARGFVAGPRLRSAQLSASPEVGALRGSRRYALRAPPTACVDFA